jgi:hypothetical protein
MKCACAPHHNVSKPDATLLAALQVNRAGQRFVAIESAAGDTRNLLIGVSNARPGRMGPRAIDRQTRRCTPLRKFSSICSQVRSVNAMMLIVVVLSVGPGKTLASHT